MGVASRCCQEPPARLNKKHEHIGQACQDECMMTSGTGRDIQVYLILDLSHVDIHVACAQRRQVMTMMVRLIIWRRVAIRAHACK